MKTKILSLLFAASIFTISASSQTIKDNIDKLAKDKSTKERSAKADVLIQKKAISDSTEIKTTPAKVIAKTPAVKQKYKSSKYKKKTKKGTK